MVGQGGRVWGTWLGVHGRPGWVGVGHLADVQIGTTIPVCATHNITHHLPHYRVRLFPPWN